MPQTLSSHGAGGASALNPFAAIVSAAQQAGVRVPGTNGPLPALVSAASSLVEAADARHSANCTVESLKAHMSVPSAADIVVQRTLAKQLHVANANNRAIVEGQKEIAARVRALKSRECIPVEREFQQDFIALLRAIFQSGPMLQQLYEDVSWAIHTPEPGAAWEDRLQPLLDAISTCQAYEAGLSQQQELLASLRTKEGPSKIAEL
ncbi:hypothetical protein GPECTOR_28g843 [Gonium pectorale]|uniref:Uncharacterized protein n=1 Tax=Gonium pectorale TaxID=33097 RepID=A0A150GF76_GONPE|nr:hypothetical protein GPECTOR_28g843 [Gonium pectorale]|eukprot:KXZ48433.1 hypothetical protein GPECTOR_28g843 [Gonium pectorale]